MTTHCAPPTSPSYYHFSDGKLTSSTANPAPMDLRAFAYGDGFFSTLGVVNGRILWRELHLERLLVGVARFEFTFDCAAVMRTLDTLAAQTQEGMLKIIIARNPQAVRGYGFIDGQACAWIKAVPAPLYAPDSVAWLNMAWENLGEQNCAIPVQITNTKFTAQSADNLTTICQNPPKHTQLDKHTPITTTNQAICLSEPVGLRTPRLAGVKLIGCAEQVFLHQTLLRQQQTTPNLAEGLVKNLAGEWVSGTSANVFYQLHSGKWHTPPTDRSGVDGTLRRLLLAQNKVSERTLFDDDLAHLTGLFFTNAVKGIVPIGTLILADNQGTITLPPLDLSWL
ncbi:hypothetical protein B0181_00695 [Moraxella caviae]|uniref:Aminodeoxychorismate lyase n=1 Tax=Moraxella caviae TaxID=34060 RepID=A0A1T0ABT8_9GAMM|nr:aminotransferase class IV [Moraxella caviae]OOR93195.1 hypothetical protein B0181_00695 [Moraxella caviae]STZ10466.1 Aminodeoxychorismate lyase [Moraxella caviae]VEW10668.1 Aminodeoxychorismate lyase [Moraxella caviae]